MRKLSSIPFKKGLLSFVCSAELHFLDWRVQSRVDDWNLVRKQEPQIATCLKSLRGKTSSILEILAIANVDLPNYHRVLSPFPSPHCTLTIIGTLRVHLEYWPLTHLSSKYLKILSIPPTQPLRQWTIWILLTISALHRSNPAKNHRLWLWARSPWLRKKLGFVVVDAGHHFHDHYDVVLCRVSYKKRPESGPWLIQSPNTKMKFWSKWSRKGTQ